MKKLLSYLRWFCVAILLQIGLIPLAYIVYPISYIFRVGVRRWWIIGNTLQKILVFPLWIFLDDDLWTKTGGDIGEEWWLKLHNIDEDSLTKWEEFKLAYKWCVRRNPAWNQYVLFNIEDRSKVILESRGRLVKDLKEVSIDNLAVLKYVNAKGEYSDNKGQYLSLKHSIIGESKIWYKIGDVLYWRYSLARQVGRFWIEIQAGTNIYRYTLRFKIKRDLKIYEIVKG